MELKVSDIDVRLALQIDELVKPRDVWQPCRWCGAAASNHVLGFMADAVYCSACGRYAGYSFPIRETLARLAASNDKRPEMRSLLGLFEEWPGGLDDEYLQIEAVITEGWAWEKSRPRILQVWHRQELLCRLRDYEIQWALGPVINRAVVERLGRIPDIDFRDQFSCPHCGASEKAQEWRNFDERARSADIYCGTCGKYIRMWDPT